ncbi:MAG: hypothetical protein LLG37_07275 [Spirochaetia bacterium]|nr:hypothetical protein [Spirochaetia bacterium]
MGGDHLRDGFWGYHDRISGRIKLYIPAKRTCTDRETCRLRTLNKQKQELEDMMGQYVFLASVRGYRCF